MNSQPVGDLRPHPTPTPRAIRCSLAHDLNSKLTVIFGCCALLLDRVTDERLKADIQAISDAAHGMAKDISQRECAVLWMTPNK